MIKLQINSKILLKYLLSLFHILSYFKQLFFLNTCHMCVYVCTHNRIIMGHMKRLTKWD